MNHLDSPMENRTSCILIPIMLVLAFLSSKEQVSVGAVQPCPKCGHVQVPYPLSTNPSCGDTLYKVRCNAGTLWFDSVNGSSYLITSINTLTQRLVIRTSGFSRNSCLTADFHSQGLQLDNNLPFNITGSNTVLLFNCSEFMVENTSLNCTDTSLCHKYIRDNMIARTNCGSTPICCMLKTGGSSNAYRIRARQDRCSAYQSFVNLDSSLPISKWPEPSVELEWALPREPPCKVGPAGCINLANSSCLKDPVAPGHSRCFCNSGFNWDPINGVCQGLKLVRPKHRKKMKRIGPILGAAFAAAVVLGVLIMVSINLKRRRAKGYEEQVPLSRVRERILSVSNGSIMAKMFSSKELIKATNNFSKDNLLGFGGFGEVFKGILEDGTITAIKRAKLGNSKGIDQILNEVKILSQVNHRHLVRLLGCCVELQQPLLIYEYIPNGTLFDHLHGGFPPLTWSQRLKIAHQTADGLAYLHSSATPPIYHRDVKSSNILLDNKFDAKVTDFGLSRLAITDTSHITTCVQGTIGYLDPEYYLNYQLTDKSDVYSFGVVLLELLTAKKAIDFNREGEDVNLVVCIKRAVREDRLLEVVDSMIREGASRLELETMKALGSLAVACLDDKRENRPTMKEAADEIEYIVSLLTPKASYKSPSCKS